MDEALQIPGMRTPPCSSRSLQRLRAGELAGDEASKVRAHAASCTRCAAELSKLEREAAQFKSEESFERFEAAVHAKQGQKRGKVMGPVSLALAAGVALILVWGPMRVLLAERHNMIKGSDSELELFVGGAGQAPRKAQENEILTAGERVRVGYVTHSKSYVLILSVDEAGVATALYPESGPSLPVEKGAGTHLMADSLELTGKGYERVIALFSDKPLDVRQALAAASQEFTKARRLDRMRELPLDAAQSATTLKKPEAR